MAARGRNPRLGRYVAKSYGSETVRASLPPPLPPDPPLRLGPLQHMLEEANQSLGRLDGLASILPNLQLFIYAYVRKEAVLSSQIEGTHPICSFSNTAKRRVCRSTTSRRWQTTSQL